MSAAREHGRRVRRFAAQALIVLPLAFLLLPTIFVFPLALNATDVLGLPSRGVSLRHFSDVLSDPAWTSAALESARIAALSALLAVVLGTATALLLQRAGRLPAEVLSAAVIVPMVIPPIVFAVAWYGLFSRMNLVGTSTALIIGHAALGLPIVFLNVSAGLRTFDQSLIRAARSLGAGPVTTFVRITAPLIAPSMAAGGLLTFVISFDELIVALFVGGGVVQTLPVVMWSQIRFGSSPAIAAVAALTVITTLVVAALAYISVRLAQRRQSRTFGAVNPDPQEALA